MGYLVNEVIKEGTGIDINGMVHDIKISYDNSQSAYRDFVDNEEYYMTIFDSDEYQQLKEQILHGFMDDIQNSILNNNLNYVKMRDKLASLTDEQMLTLKKLYEDDKIPVNAKYAVKEALESWDV